MAITIVNQWPGTAGDQDKEIIASSTPGRTLVAVVVSRVVDGSAPTLAIGDVSRNGWQLISDPVQFATSAHAAAQLQAEVWACAAVRYDGWPFHLIYASATQITASDVGSLCVNVIEVNGMTGQLTVDSVTLGTATATTTLGLTVPAPAGSANCLMIGVATNDLATAATPSGAGWTALTSTTTTAPDVSLAAAWREATTGGTVTFTGSSSNWAGVAVALRVTGTTPAQPNPAWPATSLQIGLGYDLSTPLSRVRWTDQTTRYRSMDGGDRGIQAERGTAQQANATIGIRDDDGAYTPRTVALAATATASGTTTTIKVADASAVSIHVADFFRITRGPLNSNMGFESGTSSWAPTGGTLTTSTTVVKSGTRAGQMTPDGVTATVRVDSTPNVAVTAGTVYTASGWLQCAVARTVSLNVNWFDSGGVYITTTGNDMPVAANTWTFLTADFVAPAGAVTGNVIPTLTGTPAASNVLYMDDIVFKVKTELDVFQVTSLASAAGTTTITFKRADGTPGGARAITAVGDVHAGIQIDLYIPWRLQKTVAGTTYTVGSGWLRDLPIAFSDAHWAEVNAASADALEALAGAANPSALRGEIYRRTGLYAHWPLDDSTGAGYAANASGVSNASLTQMVSKYGAGTATTASFGASTQDVETEPGIKTSLLGDPGTGWALDGITSAEMNAQKGYSLVGNDPGFPAITNGVTIFGSIVATLDQLTVISNSTTNPTVVILRNGDPGAGISAGSIIKLSFDRTSTLPIVTVWDKDTHASTSTTVGSSNLVDVEWHTWALTFDRTTWSLYVNGALKGSGSCDFVAGFSGIEVGGEASQFYNGKCGPATHAHIAMYGRKLTAGEIGNLGTIASSGWLAFGNVVELITDRVQRKLNSVGWKGVRVINPDEASVSAEDAPSGSVMDLGSELAGYEDALFFADAANQIQFRGRTCSYQQTVRAVLGDGSGEIPYQPGQTYGFEPTYIYNDVEIENTTNGRYHSVQQTTLIAIDDTSAARYGTRTLQRATRLFQNFSAWHLGWWLLSRYAYPRMRVPSVVVSAIASNDTASSTGRWAFVCGVEVGDVVTVNRRPIGQPMISVRCRVLSVQPAFKRDDGSVTGQVTLTLGAAQPLVPIANDTTYGVIGGTVLGA